MRDEQVERLRLGPRIHAQLVSHAAGTSPLVVGALVAPAAMPMDDPRRWVARVEAVSEECKCRIRFLADGATEECDWPTLKAYASQHDANQSLMRGRRRTVLLCTHPDDPHCGLPIAGLCAVA